MAGTRAAKQKQRERVYPVLRKAMGFLMDIFRRRAPLFFGPGDPGRRPCHTCAFQPSTKEWQGWDSTTLGLLSALENDQPFWCHEGFESPGRKGWAFNAEKAKVCMGWAAIVSDPLAKLCFVRASVAVQGRTISDERAAELVSLLHDCGRRLKPPQTGSEDNRVRPVYIDLDQQGDRHA